MSCDIGWKGWVMLHVQTQKCHDTTVLTGLGRPLVLPTQRSNAKAYIHSEVMFQILSDKAVDDATMTSSTAV